MQFTLTYTGPLPPNGKPAAKQVVREQLEPQLRELWTHEPLVQHFAELSAWPRGEGELSGVQELPSGYYLPIVSRDIGLTAELDIVMLRPELPGGIVRNGGDIDNRLKTLFDGLRPPLLAQEAIREPSPSPGDPGYVLLSDDELITRVSVATDRLLAAPDLNHVWITIRVRTRVQRAMWANLGL